MLIQTIEKRTERKGRGRGQDGRMQQFALSCSPALVHVAVEGSKYFDRQIRNRIEESECDQISTGNEARKGAQCVSVSLLVQLL